MIPATFAPMIAKMIFGKSILPKLIEKVANHIAETFKLPQVLNYMELPNDADNRIDKLEAQIKMLAEDQHPPVIDLDEWKDVKDTIKKLKNKKAFKKLGK